LIACRPRGRGWHHVDVATAFDPRVGLTWIERLRAGGEGEHVRDRVAVEEPLELRVDGKALAVTMRTPGDDEELAVGFLAGEGLIAGRDDVAEVGPSADLAANVVEVATRGGLRRDPGGERRFYLTSSCGICGKGALEYVHHRAPRRASSSPVAPIEPEAVRAAPGRVRRRQSAFERTGGLHATALLTADGTMLELREDVGRHDAMDKALGAELLAGRYPLTGAGVYACLSGRASFELVQKASLAGLEGVIAVGAPSTLAVELARDREMLLCGFVRGDSFNVYAGAERLAL
jgi:FdhD protein